MLPLTSRPKNSVVPEIDETETSFPYRGKFPSRAEGPLGRVSIIRRMLARRTIGKTRGPRARALGQLPGAPFG